MDKDCEMIVWTDIMFDPPQGEDNPARPGMSCWEQDFKKDAVDLMAIHRYLSEKCVKAVAGGMTSASEAAVDASVLNASPPGAVESLLNWIGDDGRQLNPAEVQQQLRGGCNMIQADENVVMAFKSGRDMCVFTTKRVMYIDVQGWTGSKVAYLSIPFKNVRAFSVESAGTWDRDAEMSLYIKCPWSPEFKQDLRKGRADIIAIQRFLAAQLFGGDDGSSAIAGGGAQPQEDKNAVTTFMGFLGDASKINAESVNTQLHTSPNILLPDETVDLAFKCGRDMFAFTTKRVLKIDVKGSLMFKSTEYTSIPLKHCHAFYVQSAGKLDWDSESKLYTDIPADGMNDISQDLNAGKVDIFEVQKLLMAKILNRG